MLKKIKKLKGRDKKKLILIILVFIIIILLVSLVISLNSRLSTIKKQSFGTEIIVSDHYGFAINGTALVFGMVTPGGSATKKLTINNNYGEDIKVKIYSEGFLSNYLEVSENDFVLEENENKTLSFSAHIPTDLEYGNYTGKVFVIIKKNNLLNKIF